VITIEIRASLSAGAENYRASLIGKSEAKREEKATFAPSPCSNKKIYNITGIDFATLIFAARARSLSNWANCEFFVYHISLEAEQRKIYIAARELPHEISKSLFYRIGNW